MMKRWIGILMVFLLALSLCACAGENAPGSSQSSGSFQEQAVEQSSSSSQEGADASSPESSPSSQEQGDASSPEEDGEEENNSPETQEQSAAGEEETEAPLSQSQQKEEAAVSGSNTFYLTVGGRVFTATFADNAGAQGLKELLEEGPVTIEARDYGGFEKVGDLGQSLPASDVQTTTHAGDIVLYQGDQIVVFYGSNSWSYTRLGQVEDLTGWEDALGDGSVSITLSLTPPQG